jgi:hypothetical protein
MMAGARSSNACREDNMSCGKAMFSAAVVVLLGGGTVALFAGCQKSADKPKVQTSTTLFAGWRAFDQIYSVLTHPRCINCHTATAHPDQGDDRHTHFANVVRGADGHGVAALQCVSCHQESNADSTGVPGGHNWHLAPLSMRWQDESGNIFTRKQLYQALIDRTKNGNLDGPKLLKHHQEEALVHWGFAPGIGIDGRPRSLPPLTHKQFVEATRVWVEAGMPSP